MRCKNSSLLSGKSILFFFAMGGGAAFPAFAHAEGMPQLEFGNWFVQAQVYWGALIFFIFMLVLKYTVMPSVDKMLTSRQERIENDLACAKQAQREAESLRADIEAKMQASKLKTQKRMQEISRARRVEFKSQETELRTKMDEKFRSAVEKMDESIAQAKGDLNTIVLPVAEFIVGRCLDGDPSEERQNARKAMMRRHAEKYLA